MSKVLATQQRQQEEEMEEEMRNRSVTAEGAEEIIRRVLSELLPALAATADAAKGGSRRSSVPAIEPELAAPQPVQDTPSAAPAAAAELHAGGVGSSAESAAMATQLATLTTRMGQLEGCTAADVMRLETQNAAILDVCRSGATNHSGPVFTRLSRSTHVDGERRRPPACCLARH